jgi:hypothetical protein
MRKLALPLLFLALASLARAQTTNINPGYCRLISNCQLGTSDGNQLWVDNPYFVSITTPAGSVRNCTEIVAYHFQYLSSPPPGVKNPAHVPFTFHVECDDSTGTITVDEQGYGYYSDGGGGKGGAGAGTRYAVMSGTVTLH